MCQYVDEMFGEYLDSSKSSFEYSIAQYIKMNADKGSFRKALKNGRVFSLGRHCSGGIYSLFDAREDGLSISDIVNLMNQDHLSADADGYASLIGGILHTSPYKSKPILLQQKTVGCPFMHSGTSGKILKTHL